jgi:type IV secretion system protein VirB5
MTPRTPLTAPESVPVYAEHIGSVWATVCSIGRARPARTTSDAVGRRATRRAGVDGLSILVAALAFLGVAPAAHAQWAVIDIGAIAQLVREVGQMEQALQVAQGQLNQAQQTYQSMTGGRGMENLLAGTVRNYLPANSAQLTSGLAGPIQATVNANAILTAAQWAALSPAEQQQLSAARGNAALLSVATQQAYNTASNRFASVQLLINAIASATDPKGIMDLQARIQAEHGMLQNDQTKLQVLFQLVQAQELSRQQQSREQAINDVGSVRTLPPLGLLQ